MTGVSFFAQALDARRESERQYRRARKLIAQADEFEALADRETGICEFYDRHPDLMPAERRQAECYELVAQLLDSARNNRTRAEYCRMYARDAGMRHRRLHREHLALIASVNEGTPTS